MGGRLSAGAGAHYPIPLRLSKIMSGVPRPGEAVPGWVQDAGWRELRDDGVGRSARVAAFVGQTKALQVDERRRLQQLLRRHGERAAGRIAPRKQAGDAV